MNMNEVIARINELAKKNKEVGLTAEELTERDKLRFCLTSLSKPEPNVMLNRQEEVL